MKKQIAPIKFTSQFCSKEFDTLTELNCYLLDMDYKQIKEDEEFLKKLLNKQS